MAEKMNVTYLLGAGASFGSITRDASGSILPNDLSNRTLPVVAEMPAWIESAALTLATSIEHERQAGKTDTIAITDPFVLGNRSYNGLRNPKGEPLGDLYLEILKLSYFARKHQSIDTFAKKLHLTKQNDDLKSFKATLSVCFDIWHYTKPPDKRYDSFLASLLEEDKQERLLLPKNVKVVSWNYDREFEFAHSNYVGLSDYTNFYPYAEYTNDKSLVRITNLIKLNGSAGFKNQEGGISLIVEPYHFHKRQEESLFDVKPSYDSLLSIGKSWHNHQSRLGSESGIKFAWETPPSYGPVESAKEAFSQADVVVAIGYTFPFFNREIDSQLLAALPSDKEVEIRIQDPSAHTIAEKLESMIPASHKRVKIVPYTYVDQFYIPMNL